MFVDTHAHVYSVEFEQDLQKVLLDARASGVQTIFMPNIDSSSTEGMHAVEKDFPFCFAMMGLHPCHVQSNYKEELNTVKNYISHRRYAAIGEIGIDLYWDKTYAKEQEIAFRTQIEWALEYQLPIVIHSRESIEQTISIVSEYSQPGFTGIFHCFTGTADQGREIIDMGFYIGIGGVLTYKNSGLDKVVATLPLDGMVLETDSPYLPPVPHRGKRNEPAFLVEVAVKLAEIKQLPLEKIGAVTTNNAKKIFSHTEWGD